MKIKLFVAREIQYFELGMFSFNSYVCYLTCGFIASTRAFNLLARVFKLPTRAFNLATHAFNLATRAFNLATRAFSLTTSAFSLLTRWFELVTRELKLVTRGFELVTCVLLFHLFNFTPFSYRIGLVKTLLHQAFVISRKWSVFHLKLGKMKELREKNLYPGDQLLKQYLHAQFSGKKRSEPNICFILQTALYYKFVDRNQTL